MLVIAFNEALSLQLNTTKGEMAQGKVFARVQNGPKSVRGESENTAE